MVAVDMMLDMILDMMLDMMLDMIPRERVRSDEDLTAGKLRGEHVDGGVRD